MYFSFSLSVFIIITFDRIKTQSECSGNLKDWDRLLHCGAHSDKGIPNNLISLYTKDLWPERNKFQIILFLLFSWTLQNSKGFIRW